MNSRRILTFTSISLCAALGAPLLLGACGDAVVVGGANSGSSSSTGSGSTPGAGVCIPMENNAPVDDACGIFVSNSLGNDAGAGTKAAPVATLAKALQMAASSQQQRVYACAEVFAEAVSIASGVAIYGGLNCNGGWSYIGEQKKTTIASGPDQVPLTIASNGTVHIEDVKADAADAAVPGGSSIGVIAEIAPTGALELVRSSLVAGKGMAGQNGLTSNDGIGPADPSDMAIAGNNGSNACTGGPNGAPGGEERANALCPTSIGGKGGNGQTAIGGDIGLNGMPSDGIYGLGGKPVDSTGCMNGGNGAPGNDGISGAGAQTSALGTIDLTGYSGVAGTDGAKGAPGQGGGGGGGGKGNSNMTCYGAGGGSGGAGGCGGNGGQGGKAGGSSIALISLNTNLSLTEVVLTAGPGGPGGNGGAGQKGAVGGNGGKSGTAFSQASAACGGGTGGQGGKGGGGGGGRGGHSIGIAHTGVAPAFDGVTVMLGSPGEGGLGESEAATGAAGEASEVVTF